MPERLFLGGHANGRRIMLDSGTRAAVEIPYVERGGPDPWDSLYCGQDIYTRRKVVVFMDHPCVRDVRIVHEWDIYVCGENPPADYVLYGLIHVEHMPPDVERWTYDQWSPNVPTWVQEVRTRD